MLSIAPSPITTDVGVNVVDPLPEPAAAALPNIKAGLLLKILFDLRLDHAAVGCVYLYSTGLLPEQSIVAKAAVVDELVATTA